MENLQNLMSPVKANDIDLKLFKAFWQGNFNVVEDILNRGWNNVNAMSDEGFTIFHIIASVGLAGYFQKFIEMGGYPLFLTKQKQSPLRNAVLNNSVEMIGVLLQYSRENNAYPSDMKEVITQIKRSGESIKKVWRRHLREVKTQRIIAASTQEN